MPKTKDESKSGLGIIARSVLHGGNAADAVTTIDSLKNSKIEEKNPIYGSNPSNARVALTKGLTSAAEDILLSKLAKKHPIISRAVAMGIGGLNAGIAFRNYKQSHVR